MCIVHTRKQSVQWSESGCAENSFDAIRNSHNTINEKKKRQIANGHSDRLRESERERKQKVMQTGAKQKIKHSTVEQSRAQRIECDIKCNRPMHETALERARTRTTLCDRPLEEL